MRYFLLIGLFFSFIIIPFVQQIPTYDLTIERSVAVLDSPGRYRVITENPKNIWYISIDRDRLDDNMCVEWQFADEKKTECIDHDGEITGTVFSFPVLSNASTEAHFQILGHPGLSPHDITVYSLDSRASGSRFSLAFPHAAAENGIISRAEWGADEAIRYADTGPLKPKQEAYLKYVAAPKTPTQLKAIQYEDTNVAFIKSRGGETAVTNSLRRYENGHRLYRPIEKTKQVSKIVLHHTAQSLDTTQSDEEIIRGIYAYHAVSRGWGDIGYNYLIGQRGRIYEGRAGGDYVVASHVLMNNVGTVGISVLGDYNKNHLNRDQIAGVEQAITMMALKYGITLSDTKEGFIACNTSSCPSQLKSVYTKSLIGHQDIGHTDCPGSDIYDRIPDMIARLDRHYSPVFNPEIGVIDPLPADQVMNMSLKPESVSPDTSQALKVPILPLRYTGPKFRVRLSYPDENHIALSLLGSRSSKLLLDKKNIAMSSIGTIEVTQVGQRQLLLKIGNSYYTGSEIRLSGVAVRIDSWSRVPDWDTTKKYNDNIFRDTIRIMNNNGKLLVVNDLPVEWYLKGLGEVSNGDLSEKIKVIVVAARSYARYYMDPKNRKFATNLYDGSDDPDEFQKYLGYGYESRSPNVAKLVDMTRNQVITYSGSLIKPWYHSSSDGRTLSAIEYCQKNGSKNCTDIPYLQAVEDPGGVGRTRSGHGVGISGIGATYWANLGWNYQKIIQYYMKGVEIQRK